jgi:hypothetical protein
MTGEMTVFEREMTVETSADLLVSPLSERCRVMGELFDFLSFAVRSGCSVNLDNPKQIRIRRKNG